MSTPLSLKEACAEIDALLDKYASPILPLGRAPTVQAMSAAVRRGELTYVTGTKKLEPVDVEKYGLAFVREEMLSSAMYTTCEPDEFGTPAGYHAACARVGEILRKSGLFTEEEVEQHSRPMVAIL